MAHKISALYLHQAITIPGTTILGTPTIIFKKHPLAKMTWEDDHILICEKGIEAMIPLAAVATAIRDKEEVKKK